MAVSIRIQPSSRISTSLPAALINTEGARYKALGLRVAGDSPQRLLDRALTEPRLLKTPLVRNSGKVTVGHAADDWQAWIDAEKTG